MDLYVREDGTLAIRQPRRAGAYRATGTPDMTPIYDNAGLFSVCGMDPQVVSAIVNPIGVESILRWVGTVETSPIYDALVDIQSSGYDQASGCAACGKPSFKEAPLTSKFGRYCQQTPEVQFDQIGLKKNRGVAEVALFGNITAPDGTVLFRQGQQITDQFVLGLFGSMYNLRAELGRQMWEGDGSRVGGRWEMIGLETIVNTGKFDAIDHTLIPAFDSQLLDFGSNVVGATGSPSIRQYIRSLILSIRYRITAMGHDPDSTEMYVVMHPRTWDAVAAALACEYGIACETGADSYQDAREVERYRERLVGESIIPIDGRDYPVVKDNQIPQTLGYYGDQTSFCSDIYVLTTVSNGMTVLYGEYQDFQQTARQAMAEMRRLFGTNYLISITDGGKFTHATTNHGGWCWDVKTMLKPRLVCKMPQLQGRIQNVCVTTLANYPDVTGSGGLYAFDAGLEDKPYLGLYDDAWSSGDPVPQR